MQLCIVNKKLRPMVKGRRSILLDLIIVEKKNNTRLRNGLKVF